MTFSRNASAVILVVVLVTTLWICPACRTEAPGTASNIPIGTPVNIEAPLGLPPVPIPIDNPPTAETISLGRRLYFDPSLSVDGTVACASCHSPEFGFSDGKPVSEGVDGQKGGRNAPTVWNSAYYTTQFWDGRAPNLESRRRVPYKTPLRWLILWRQWRKS